MGENPILTFRGVLPVAVAALFASLVIAAVAIAETISLRANGEPLEFLGQVALPMFWIAALNKPLIRLAAAIVREPDVAEWLRTIKLGSALLGIGYGSLAGVYLMLVAYGRSVLRNGGVFDAKVVWYLKWALLTICAAYGLIGIGYLVYLRGFLGDPLYAQTLPVTFGYFLLCLLQCGVLSLAVYWGNFVVQSWIRNRQRKTWR
jgi:hypothetical protein